MMRRFKEKYIGDRAFYRNLMKIAVPIMIQNGITNFVSLLDNIMVGQCGTEAMSGVAIVNQLFFVFFLCCFGAEAGVGIFTAQYCGVKDDEGVRHTFRYKFWLLLLLSAGAALLFYFCGHDLINLYLKGESEDVDPVLALQSGLSYLKIVGWSIPAIMISMNYNGTLRECGETVTPMKAGVVAVFVNLIFNWLLIYGHFGFPKLGVQGAAIATVLSRYIEMLIVLVWAHLHTKIYPFVKGLWKSLKVPANLVAKFFLTGMPLMINEALWSLGIATLTQCYSVRGINVLAGQSIANTINNIFNIVFIAMGDAVAIIVGQLLGAGDMKRAKDEDNKIIAFAVLSSVAVGALMFISSPFVPLPFKVTSEAKMYATQFIMVQAVAMPHNAFLHAAYFTIRSGGRTIITFLFDSVFMFVVSVPAAFLLTRFTDIYVIWIFAIVAMLDWIKCVMGYILVKKNVWMKNIVTEEK